MYLRTPKRYTVKGSKRPLISLRWLWLYLLAPIVIVVGALAWDMRADLSQNIGGVLSRIKLPQINAPTATPTLPAADLKARIGSAMEAGNVNDAIEAMRSYADSVPNETTWHAALAQTLIMRSHGADQKMIEQANQAGQAAINANPEAVDGWVTQAFVLDWSDQSQAALSYALRAKDLGDSTGMTNAVLAGIYRTLRDPKQAAALADEAIKLNPNLAYAYYVKAQLASDEGANKQALGLYKQAWEIARNNRMQWSGYIADTLAQAYLFDKQPDQAVAVLNDALQRDKDDPALYYRLAMVYYNKGEFDGKASEYAQTCLDHNQAYAPCHGLMAKLQYIGKRYEAAAQSAQRAIELGIPETSVYWYGGDAYYKLNKCPEAILMFRAGLTLAEKINSTQAKGDFVASLADCGIVQSGSDGPSNGVPAQATAAATTAATTTKAALKATTPPPTATKKR